MKDLLSYEYTFNNLPLQWKGIKGFEGIYQVSNYGDIKRLTHMVHRNKQGNFIIYEKILKPHITPKGYLRIQLYKDGKGYNYFIHRLVAEAFIPNPENKSQVNHKDTNKANSYIENLEWCTNSENQLHAYRTGLQQIKYKIYCKELNIFTNGVGEMERQLKRLGYENINGSSILACLKRSGVYLGLHFEKL